MKTCTKCKTEYPATAEYFKLDVRYNNGLTSWCRKCHRQYYQDNKQKRIDTAAQWYKDNPVKTAHSMRKQWYRLRYKTTITDYDFFMHVQHDKCAICGKTEQDIGKYLDIDHDHFTGLARGLLCNVCNNLVGMAENMFLINEKLLEKVEKYLAGRVELSYNI